MSKDVIRLSLRDYTSLGIVQVGVPKHVARVMTRERGAEFRKEFRWILSAWFRQSLSRRVPVSGKPSTAAKNAESRLEREKKRSGVPRSPTNRGSFARCVSPARTTRTARFTFTRRSCPKEKPLTVTERVVFIRSLSLSLSLSLSRHDASRWGSKQRAQVSSPEDVRRVRKTSVLSSERTYAHFETRESVVPSTHTHTRTYLSKIHRYTDLKLSVVLAASRSASTNSTLRNCANSSSPDPSTTRAPTTSRRRNFGARVLKRDTSGGVGERCVSRRALFWRSHLRI